jgi:choline-sulfatase
MSLPHRLIAPALLLASLLPLTACGREAAERTISGEAAAPRASILLVTLDTTRADSIGPDAAGINTAAFNELARQGRLYRQAYATAPETLPSHASMMTGLYPGGHGIHENARYLQSDQPLLAERLKEAGYQTAAFVSAFPLDRRFGLAAGFDIYDDEMPAGQSERNAQATTERAIAWLQQASGGPVFLWVHYFDPHYPYEPPEPFRSQYPDNAYLGEIAAMDHEMGRLLTAFRQKAGGEAAVIVTGDHGEALGDHGEAQHGNLLYQGVMRVPLVLAGPGISPGVEEHPVSNRRIFFTILDWAGLGSDHSLRPGPGEEIVVGEAMKPFLNFGWQPQVMAVEGRYKVIFAGTTELYDVVADPQESRDLSATGEISRGVRQTLRDYPLPSPAAPPVAQTLSEEDRQRLASLGYVSGDARPVVRKDAPRPRDMAHLFETIDRASGLFIAGEYRAAIPLLRRILEGDSHNLMAALHLAAAHSALGQTDEALEAFRRAGEIAPDSSDVRHYLAMHHLRHGEWQRAEPLLGRVLADSPDRLPALEAMATIRERQQRFEEALRLRQRVLSVRTPTAADLIHLGGLAMETGNTPVAIEAFERARRMAPQEFAHDLELGVLYVDARRFPEARQALDRVPRSHGGWPMALFKRAQVSVLLNEPDQAQRIAQAREHADEVTRRLIERERLFQRAAAE